MEKIKTICFPTNTKWHTKWMLWSISNLVFYSLQFKIWITDSKSKGKATAKTILAYFLVLSFSVLFVLFLMVELINCVMQKCHFRKQIKICGVCRKNFCFRGKLTGKFNGCLLGKTSLAKSTQPFIRMQFHNCI